MITYDYYRIFYFVAQYSSFTRAAEILGNNQPNITRCINNLESELGCRLFVRSNRGVTLTPEGKRLFAHISIAYEQIFLGEQELLRDRSLESGLVNIGASETALRIFLLDRLETFHEQYPHVRLRISNYTSPQAIEALAGGLVDFSVVTAPLHIRRNFRVVPLYSFHDIMIGGPKYTSAASQVRSLEELSGYPFITLGNNTGTRELYMQFFMNHSLPFHPDMEAATTDQILPMVRHNLGIGFFPDKLAQDALSRNEIVHIRLKEQTPKRSVYLIYDNTRSRSIAAQKLMNTLQPDSHSH